MQGQFAKWAMGILAALITASVAWGGSTLVDHAERIMRSETQYGALQNGQQRIEAKQDKLSDKIDRLFDRLPQR